MKQVRGSGKPISVITSGNSGKSDGSGKSTSAGSGDVEIPVKRPEDANKDKEEK